MERKVPTIKEIAKQLKVSVSTVSRALHNHPSIGLRTKMQVHALAKELDYEPNQAAIHFKQRRTFIIGVILPELREEFFSLAMNGIEDVAGKNSYSVLIGQSHDDVERERQIVAAMKRNRVDGILVSLAKSTTDYTHFEDLYKVGIPVVFFDREPQWEKAYCVQATIETSTYQIIHQLFEEGHMQIGHIQGPSHFPSMAERVQGYTRALKAHKKKTDPTLQVTTDLSKESTIKAMQKLMALKKPPTAVLCFNDYVAFDAIQAARKHYGKALNIAFVSYANLPVGHYMDHSLKASIEQFPYLQGEKAMELLLQRIADPDNPPAQKRIYIESEIVMHG